MTVYFDKRRRRWCYDFEINKQRRFGYCLDVDGNPVKSRRAALEAEAAEKRKTRIAPKHPAGPAVTVAVIVDILTPRWEKEARWLEFKRYLREMLAFFGPSTPIAAIDDGQVATYVDHLRVSPVRRWNGGPKRDPADPRNKRFWVSTTKIRAPATVNLYLEPLRQCLDRAARLRDPITRVPVIAFAPEVPELKRPKRKARPVPDWLIGEILTAMPAHVVDAIMLTLFFGFRKGEAFGLKRGDIDWDRSGVRLEHERVKDDEDAFLPGSQLAMGWLRCLDFQAEERGIDHLIAWRRFRKAETDQIAELWRPLKDPHSAWERARKIMIAKAGKTWRWHDLRAAFITHVAETSGQLAAQALARHSDYATTAMYVEAADELRRLAADRASDRPLLRSMK